MVNLPPVDLKDPLLVMVLLTVKPNDALFKIALVLMVSVPPTVVVPSSEVAADVLLIVKLPYVIDEIDCGTLPL